MLVARQKKPGFPNGGGTSTVSSAIPTTAERSRSRARPSTSQSQRKMLLAEMN